MTRRFLLIAFLLSATTTTAAKVLPAAAAVQDPTGFIRGLGNQALAVLSSSVATTARENRFKHLYEHYFDTPTIARFVLGRYWWVATPAQRQQFEELFEKYVVFAYSARLSAYSGEKFHVLGSRPEGGDFLVSSEILRPGGEPPTKLVWRVHREGGNLKIVDVIVEGISMALTQRQEFASVIVRNGGSVGALLTLMQQKIAQVEG